ncbi:hypothetical protein PGTUg99_035428 [Puccinia graminis f. sp. tritici]|uniref:Uncharacterized protein n=1 Tax=Puccinia graminis f. sp. tritici TaxID=56615 RepID=A0A5B0SEL4_PUCGR|nr:hypothetical protein PGTUg99_035428 [Puccinia graminis f. sp. tritici]
MTYNTPSDSTFGCSLLGLIVLFITHRIAENRKKYHLSKKLLDLRTQILPTRPSPTDGSRWPMWIGEIEDDPVIHETLEKNLEAALQEIEKAAAACSRKWALKFIDKVRHNEFHWCDGQLRELKHTFLSQTFSAE